VAVGFTREEALEWWPQDATDLPLVSSRSFEVVGDGYECDRFEKAWAIRDWREAEENLRVCYRPGSWSRNCGACMKCRAMLLFSHAVHGRAVACFGRAATLADVRSVLASEDPNAALRLSQFVRHARALGRDDALVREAARGIGGQRPCPPAR
jgi:hypothetical protein